jgi:acyl-CoA synthetase (AMP-forming)/AMP-acid ligase II
MSRDAKTTRFGDFAVRKRAGTINDKSICLLIDIFFGLFLAGVVVVVVAWWSSAAALALALYHRH